MITIISIVHTKLTHINKFTTHVIHNTAFCLLFFCLLLMQTVLGVDAVDKGPFHVNLCADVPSIAWEFFLQHRLDRKQRVVSTNGSNYVLKASDLPITQTWHP